MWRLEQHYVRHSEKIHLNEIQNGGKTSTVEMESMGGNVFEVIWFRSYWQKCKFACYSATIWLICVKKKKISSVLLECCFGIYPSNLSQIIEKEEMMGLVLILHFIMHLTPRNWI